MMTIIWTVFVLTVIALLALWVIGLVILTLAGSGAFVEQVTGNKELTGNIDGEHLALVRSTAWLEIAQAILAESSNRYHRETADSLLQQIDTNNVALKGML